MSLNCPLCKKELPDSPHGLHIGWPPDQVECPACGACRSTTGEYRWMWAYLMLAMPGAVPAIALVLVPMVASGGHLLVSLVPAVVIGLVVDAILAMLIACPVALVGRAISRARKRGRVYRWPRRGRGRPAVSSRGG